MLSKHPPPHETLVPAPALQAERTRSCPRVQTLAADATARSQTLPKSHGQLRFAGRPEMLSFPETPPISLPVPDLRRNCYFQRVLEPVACPRAFAQSAEPGTCRRPCCSIRAMPKVTEDPATEPGIAQQGDRRRGRRNPKSPHTWGQGAPSCPCGRGDSGVGVGK